MHISIGQRQSAGPVLFLLSGEYPDDDREGLIARFREYEEEVDALMSDPETWLRIEAGALALADGYVHHTAEQVEQIFFDANVTT